MTVSKADAPYPYLGINGEYYDKQYLDDVWIELHKKAPMWAAGIETPSKAERFAYHVLKQITMRQPNEKLSTG